MLETRKEHDTDAAALFDKVAHAQQEGWRIDRLWHERHRIGWWRQVVIFYAWMVR